MSSPAKKASTGGIRKTTIKNNLYLKNRAALRERGFFILWITSSIKPPLSRGFGCFMNRHEFFASRSYHGSRMPKSCKGRPLSYPRGASTDTGPTRLSAADDKRKKRGCEEINPHFFTAPFYFAFIWFRVQGSGFSWRLRRLFLEDGILVSQPSPLGEGARKGRIG